MQHLSIDEQLLIVIMTDVASFLFYFKIIRLNVINRINGIT